MRHERIEIDPAIPEGKPVIRGTRVPVELVLRELASFYRRSVRWLADE